MRFHSLRDSSRIKVDCYTSRTCIMRIILISFPRIVTMLFDLTILHIENRHKTKKIVHVVKSNAKQLEALYIYGARDLQGDEQCTNTFQGEKIFLGYISKNEPI